MDNSSAQSPPLDSAMPVLGVHGTSLTNFSAVNFDQFSDLEPLAQQILADPVALQRLSDRVFKLLEQEVRSLRERGATR